MKKKDKEMSLHCAFLIWVILNISCIFMPEKKTVIMSYIIRTKFTAAPHIHTTSYIKKDF